MNMKVLFWLLAILGLIYWATEVRAEQVATGKVAGWVTSCHVGKRLPACFMSKGGLSVQVQADRITMWFMDEKWRTQEDKAYQVWMYKNSSTEAIDKWKCFGANFELEGGYACQVNFDFENIDAIQRMHNVGIFVTKQHQKWYDLTGSAKAMDWVLDNLSKLDHKNLYPKTGGIDG